MDTLCSERSLAMNFNVFELILSENLEEAPYYKISENQFFFPDSSRCTDIFKTPKLSAIGTECSIADRCVHKRGPE